MESLPDDFLESLGKDFIQNRPFRDEPVDYDDEEDDFSSSVYAPSWHELIRDHVDNKPPIPRSTLNIGAPDINLRSRLSKTQSGPNISSPMSKKKKTTAPRYELEASGFSELCKQGWTLSKGWRKRPKGAQIDPYLVAGDIKAVAERYERARRRNDAAAETSFGRSGGFTSSRAQRLSPEQWPENDNASVFISKSRIQSPGPKYGLQPNLARVSSRRTPCRVAKPPARQGSDYTCKDLTFSQAERMPNGNDNMMILIILL